MWSRPVRFKPTFGKNLTYIQYFDRFIIINIEKISIRLEEE